VKRHGVEGIADPTLHAAYRECQRLNAEHGKTYYLATLLLPKAKRPHVHALYGFARYADEIVDTYSADSTVEARSAALHEFSTRARADIARGTSEDLILSALVHTIKEFSIPHSYFDAFLDSMAMDLWKGRYENYDELKKYMYGSAAVIGLEMLPILGSVRAEAMYAAERLGEAFQLANFIRDIGEDLDRNRIYMPLDEFAQFGVTEAALFARKLTPEMISAIKFQIARVRALQKEAKLGIPYLDKVSRPCIEAASELYCGIVDEVEKNGYDIFTKRAKTSTLRRARVALPAAVRALLASSGARKP
jgi:phytoene synthase